MTQLSSTTFANLFDFSRASTATYVDSNGVIQTATSDTKRLTYDPATGAAQGLLIEEARANLRTYSEDLTSAGLSVVRGSISSDATTAPDGATTADQFVEDTSNDTHILQLQNGITHSNGTTYTYSAFIKDAGRAEYRINFGTDSGVFAGEQVDFDLSDGSITTSGGGSGGTEEYGDGWWRVWATATAAADATGVVRSYPLSGGTSSYLGDGSSGLYVWGVQTEAGPSPTSYIPTSGATATRAAEAIPLQGDDFADIWNRGAGTFYVEFKIPAVVSGSIYNVFSASNGSTNEAIRIIVFSDGTVRCIAATDGTWEVAISLGAYTAGTTVKVAFAFDATSGVASVNGAAAVTDSTLTGLPVGITGLAVGSPHWGGVGHINGTIAEVRYWPEKLTDSQLEAMTA